MGKIISMVALALGASVGAGCATPVSLFASHQYNHPQHDYSVVFPAGSDMRPRFLDGAWSLDNYYLNTEGRLVPRAGARYTASVAYDADGDGVLEGTQADLPLYDLRLLHAETNSSIAMRTFPIAGRFARTDLRTLAHLYVESLAGSGATRVDMSEGVSVTEGRRYATQILEEAPTTVDGTPAYAVTFEIANVDQLEVDGDSRGERVRMVFVRSGFGWLPDPLRAGRTYREHWPVLTTIEHRATPEHFEAEQADFETFLSQVSFGAMSDALGAHREAFFSCWDQSVPDGRVPVLVDVSVSYEGEVRNVVVRSGLSPTTSSFVPSKIGACFRQALGTTRLPRTGRTTSIVFDPNPAAPAVAPEPVDPAEPSAPAAPATAVAAAEPVSSAEPSDAAESTEATPTAE